MKPDRRHAMQQLITQVKSTFPLDNPELAVLNNNDTPSFGDLEKFAKLCKNVHRGLSRNGVF
ncbi:hypothetical protein [Shewanella aestuarii]|uniref:Uncharacterized protein n=1 Tax=Shewanella aestuarii TaxID=1028752 RepID=A0A6G9QHL9_9GAMM|nr:hypothetical protein [Shewanella aestuarii]QIR13557.1 hypothetical protein HBH39_02740 [Shewanella aestuarii]